MALVGAYIWYSSRPKPPKPWDAKSIVAQYRNLNDEDDKIGFVYILVNNSDEDFRLSQGSGNDVGLRIDSSDVYDVSDQYVKFNFPILVPAHQQALLTLSLNESNHPKLKAGASTDERDQNRFAIEKYLVKEKAVLNGFVILDESGRRRIELPAGWKTTK